MRICITKDRLVEYTIEGTKNAQVFDVDRQLGLLRVSRQIYSETATLVYRLNTFFFDEYDKLSAFRYGLKQAHWEASCTIAISVPLARKMYTPLPPTPPGQRAARHSGGSCYVRIAKDIFALYHFGHAGVCTLGHMFQFLRTIVVDKGGQTDRFEDVLNMVRKVEGSSKVLLE
jgi:hypothetical protein